MSVLGALRALVDAYLWPSKVWIRLRLEAEDRVTDRGREIGYVLGSLELDA